MSNTSSDRPSTRALVIGALGIVFGDIGTSPLYALKECFHGRHGVPISNESVLGVLSLIFWSLIIIVSIKYLAFVMRADNKGEGGVLALMALVVEKLAPDSRRRRWLLMLGVFGAALLYGDGMITPAITTLGAVEGLSVATDVFAPWVVPFSMLILVLIFSFQRIGTERVGRLFGPVMIIWFAALAALGIRGILMAPSVLAAVNPWHGVHYLLYHGWLGFAVLGAVVLVVTGCEALYADMGHFGIMPIRRGWFILVLPALMLNYLGQGALLLSQPELQTAPQFNPFYMLAPGWALYPLVVLATAAAVIASQALISGSYSITLQAIQLGYLPRVSIRHTSAHTAGQIYIGIVNWILLAACLGLVKGFGSSSALASAYGIAVTLTMMVTTIVFFFVARDIWGWHPLKLIPPVALVFGMEFAFFSANAVKILDGGWFPVAVGAGLFIVMTTWRTGRALVGRDQDQMAMTQEMFLESLAHSPHLTRVPGTAIFMSGNRGKTPTSLLHNLKHNKVLHERVVFLTILTAEQPFVPREKQVELEELKPNIFRMTGHYGFMQDPNVPQLLRRARAQYGFECDADDVTFFLGRETIVPSHDHAMAGWREHLFAFLSRLAQTPAHYFRLPENRVVELGVRVKI